MSNLGAQDREAIRERDEKIEELESKIRRLSARSQSKDEATRDARAMVSSADYAKLAKSRAVLEEKCRQYKEIHLKWQHSLNQAVENGMSVQELRASLLTQINEYKAAKRRDMTLSKPKFAQGLLSDGKPSQKTRSPRIVPGPKALDAIGLQESVQNGGPIEDPQLPDSTLKRSENSENGDAETIDGEAETSSGIEEGPELAFKVKSEASAENESPEFVSERSLKRKRTSRDPSGSAPSSHSQTQSHGAKKVAVKEEILSSSPTVPPGAAPIRFLLDMPSSLDLDDIGQQVRTPKKQRRNNRRAYFQAPPQSQPLSQSQSDHQARARIGSTNQLAHETGFFPPEINYSYLDGSTEYRAGTRTETEGKEHLKRSSNKAAEMKDLMAQSTPTTSRKAVSTAVPTIPNIRPITSAIGPPNILYSNNATTTKTIKDNDTTATNEHKSSAAASSSSSSASVSPADRNQLEDSGRGHGHGHGRGRGLSDRSSDAIDTRPLRQRDPNILPRTSPTTWKNPGSAARGKGRETERRQGGANRRRDCGAAYVPHVAEDGDQHDAYAYALVANGKGATTFLRNGRNDKDKDMDTDKGQDRDGNEGSESNSRTRTPHLSKRLESLLEKPTPGRAPLSNQTSTTTNNNKKSIVTGINDSSKLRPKNLSTPINTSARLSPPSHRTAFPIQSTLKSSDDLALNAHGAFKTPTSCIHPATEDAPLVLPEHEPLRVRKPERLKLTDFKLNPTHSESAYHQTVRKHDEKRALAGCADPFCQRCKDIASFAEISGFVPAARPGLFDDTATRIVTHSSGGTKTIGQAQGHGDHDEQEAADRRILEQHLGKEGFESFTKNVRSTLSADEYARLVRQSRTQLFADHFGKHRQAHPRAVTPPDFWNPDMPSTQEEAKNREAARAIELEQVQERYYEALRGGRWKFADE